MAEFPILPIRYDGLDAERHELELDALSQSLHGLSRIISMWANFAATGKVVKRADAMAIRVYAKEPRPNCYTISVVADFIQENQILSGTGLALLGGLGWLIRIGFARASKDKAEMEAIKELFLQHIKSSGETNQAYIRELSHSIDRLAELAVKPSREAVAPVGVSCEQLTIGTSSEERTVIDRAMKHAIMLEDPVEITEPQEFRILINELDLVTHRCHFWIEGDEDKRYVGEISDPAIATPENIYKQSLGQPVALIVTAKATLKDGEIDRLYISDAREP